MGRIPLLLLDSDIEENGTAERTVTDRLYGGGEDHRLRQELLLGIGGVRAIRAFCALTGHAEPEVFHTNEGHAGFLGIERIRELAESGPKLTFDAALEAVRAGEGGKKLIQEMVRFTDDPEIRYRIAFLPDYDIGMTRYLLLGLRRLAQQPFAPTGGLRHVS